MSAIAIRAENLSKQYRVGARTGYRSGREALIEFVIGLFRRRRKGPREMIWALDDVSLEVERGEVVGIIGRNGAGKSTLLKILSRITEPTRGRAELRGRVGSLLEVGTGFHPELTGRENIFLNGAILGMSRVEITRKFDEIVEFAGIDQFIDTPVKRYSSGMYVRLAFSVAAHLEPEIMLVDEVLAVGDAAFQRKCLGQMRMGASGGRTVLFVSHDMGAVRSLCTRTVWIDKARIERIGPTPEVVAAYLEDALGGGAAGSFKLDSLQRPSRYMGDNLRFESLTINEGGPVCHGEPLTMTIRYSAKEEVVDAAFGIGFSSLDGGVRVLSLASDLSGLRLHLQSTASGVVEVTIDSVELRPGTYLLSMSCLSGPSCGLDYLPSFATVQVLPGPKTPPTVIHAVGGVVVGGSWRVHRP